MTLPTIANVTDPKQFGYGLRINDNYYRLALGLQTGRIAQSLSRFQASTETSAEEVNREKEVKTYAQTDFTGGDGLMYAHHPENDEYDATRVWQTRNIYTTKGQGNESNLRISHRMEQHTPDNVTPDDYRDAWTSQLAFAYGKMFAVNDNNLAVVDNPGTNADVVTWTYETIVLDEECRSLAVLNGELYALMQSTGIYKRDAAGVWTQWSAVNYGDHMWSSKGRLIVDSSDGKALLEVTASGDKTLLTVGGDDQFTDVVDAGLAILVGTTEGTVYALGTEAGELVLKGESDLKDAITGLYSHFGLVLVGTSDTQTSRLWIGALGGDYGLKNLQVLRQFDADGFLDDGPRGFAVTGTDVYFTRRDSGGPELWRFDLATSGLFMHRVADDAAEWLLDVVSYQGRLYFRERSNRTVGIERDDVAKRDIGYVVSPLIDFFDSEEKVWTDLKVYVDFLDLSDTTLRAYYSSDPQALEDVFHASWQQVTLDAGHTGRVDTTGRWLAVKLEIDHSVGVNPSPVVRGFEVSAYPGPGDTAFELPVNASDRIERPGRASFPLDGHGDEIYTSLKGTEGTAVELEDIATGDVYRGTITEVVHERQATPSRGSASSACIVRFKGRRS